MIMWLAQGYGVVAEFIILVWSLVQCFSPHKLNSSNLVISHLLLVIAQYNLGTGLSF